MCFSGNLMKVFKSAINERQLTKIPYLKALVRRQCAYQGVRKCLFSRKFGVLCFLKTPVFEIHHFALLPTPCGNQLISEHQHIFCTGSVKSHQRELRPYVTLSKISKERKLKQNITSTYKQK